MQKIYVVNSSGQKESFSRKKVYHGALGAGVPEELANVVADVIEKEVYPGMTTQEIFSRVKQLLSKEHPQSAIRYNLKEAMRKLGPSGFPFEKYTADIFEQLGFSVKVNQFIFGKCVSHEVDFLAQKEGKILAGECKFHIFPGERVDVKVALAHYARFLDLKSGDILKGAGDSQLFPMIVTNTKFTDEALKYSQCLAMDLLGWKHPLGGGLEHIIESKKLYPVTILPSLKKSLLDILSREQMMLVQDLLDVEPAKFFSRFGVPEKDTAALKKEAQILLEGN